MTVKNARGYAASSFIYGTYGCQESRWKEKKGLCLPTGPMNEQANPDDFRTKAKEVLAEEPHLLERLLVLRNDVMDTSSLSTEWQPTAEEINARNQEALNLAAQILGRERFERIFGFEAGAEINLVDPNLLIEDENTAE